MERLTFEQHFKLDIRQAMPDPYVRWNFLVTLKNRAHPSFTFYPWLNDLLNELKSDGFAALPAPVIRPWWAVLEVSPTATRDAIATSYWRLARERHPDAGGSNELMAELNAARAAALTKRN
jgi:DnaJ-domain-containing protein 1